VVGGIFSGIVPLSPTPSWGNVVRAAVVHQPAEAISAVEVVERRSVEELRRHLGLREHSVP
jgi:hypothetical protein